MARIVQKALLAVVLITIILKILESVNVSTHVETLEPLKINAYSIISDPQFQGENTSKESLDAAIKLLELEEQNIKMEKQSVQKQLEEITSRENQLQVTRKFLESSFLGNNDLNPSEKQNSRVKSINHFHGLGAYPEIGRKYFNREEMAKPLYDKTNYGIINENDYCDRVDQYNLEHPEEMFTKMTFFTDYPYKSETRVKAEQAGELTMKYIHRKMPAEENDKPQYYLDMKITSFHTNLEEFYEYHKIGQNFLCATQMHNHIPGNGALVRKDLSLQRIKLYKEKYRNRPECFNPNTIFLPFYRLFNGQECKSFFELIHSDAYKKSLIKNPIQYIVKVGYGAHKSEGAFLLDEETTQDLNEYYHNGATCGKEKESLIVQKYIQNPLLLDLGNKFDFRIFMLIASTNPLIVYYHDGYIRASLNKFDLNSNDRATHLTNTFLAQQIFNEARKENKTVNGMTYQELMEYHLWDMKDLQDYLLSTGKITDPKWLNNYLRPLFQKAFIHLVKMSSDAFWNQSNVYELHGLDFMLDVNLNLWFIESNPNPLLAVKQSLIGRMMTDLFDIQYAYYRSRMKRVLEVIRQIEAESAEDGKVDYEKWKGVYQLAVKNRLEPEFQVRKNNTFTLILDESKPKEKAYFGHVPSGCFC